MLQLFNAWTHSAFSDQSSTFTQKSCYYNDFSYYSTLFILLAYFSRRIIVWLAPSLSSISSRFIVSLLASLLSTTLKSAEDKITVTGRNVVSLPRRWKNQLWAKKAHLFHYHQACLNAGNPSIYIICTAGTVMHSGMKWTAYWGQTLYKRNRTILKTTLASLIG